MNKESTEGKKSLEIYIFTRFSRFVMKLTKILHESHIEVIVITEEVGLWRKKIRREEDSNNTVQVKGKCDSYRNANYLMFFLEPEDVCIKKLDNTHDLIRDVYKNKTKGVPKILIAVPYILEKAQNSILYKFIRKNKIIENSSIAYLFVGDVYSISDKSKEDFKFNKFIRQIFNGNNKKIYRNRNLFYPVEDEQLLKAILGSLFSLKAYGKLTALVSNPFTIEEIEASLGMNNITERNKKQLKQRNIVLFGKQKMFVRKETYTLANVDEAIQLKNDRKLVSELIKDLVIKANRKRLRRTLFSVIRKGLKLSMNEKNNKKERENCYLITYKFLKSLKNPGKYRSLVCKKMLVICFMAVPAFFALPLVLVLINSSLFYVSKSLYKNGSYVISEKAHSVVNVLTKVNENATLLTKKIRLVDGIYDKALSVNKIINISSKIIFEKTVFLQGVSDLFDYSLSENKSVDRYEFRNLFFTLNDLLNESGKLKAETRGLSKELNVLKQTVLENDFGTLQFDRYKLALPLLETTGNLLGSESPKTYLVLFQDSTSLRPTGGIINFFALATFNKGILEDIKTYDVDYADSKLTGIISPPYEVRKYFGSNNWYLKDSNWDPNFSESAKRAEWFIDKEMGTEVDGVLAVDTELIKDYLRVTGFIKFDEKGEIVNSENSDEVLQNKCNQETPEDYQYDRQCNLLIKAFFEKNKKVKRNKKIAIVNLLHKALNEKKLQVYLHNQTAQNAISKLNWDGGMKSSNCDENCYVDFVGLIQTDIGDLGYKSIRQEIDFFSSIEEGLIKRTLTVLIENPTDINYKTHLRLFVNSDSGFGKVSVLKESKKHEIEPRVYSVKNLKEGSIYYEIEPKQLLAISFNWEGGVRLDLSKKGMYEINIRKQAGISSVPFGITIDVPNGNQLVDSDVFNLTRDGVFEYNSTLAEDLTAHLTWKERE